MNNFVFLTFSILDLSKIAMYEFWYDYVKPKYVENMDADSFIDHDIDKNIEARFDTSNNELARPLPKRKK